jgi:hypothetical protein
MLRTYLPLLLLAGGHSAADPEKAPPAPAGAEAATVPVPDGIYALPTIHPAFVTSPGGVPYHEGPARSSAERYQLLQLTIR